MLLDRLNDTDLCEIELEHRHNDTVTALVRCVRELRADLQSAEALVAELRTALHAKNDGEW